MQPITDRVLRIPAVPAPAFAATASRAFALSAALALAASARADDEIAGVGDAFDAAELVPAATAGALPPILPGQEPGARERGAVSPEAPPADGAREWFGHSDFWTWSRLTGDWAGVRSTLESAGVDFNGSLINEWSGVFEGDSAGKSAYRFLLDLNVGFDLGVIAGLEGGTVFADFQTADTGVGGLDHGAFQAYSNIAIGGSITQLSQLWYEQWLFDRLVRVKLGKVDANTEFAYIPAAGGFINASAGFTPTIVALPTYPNAATSANLFVYPSDELYFGAGIYDGGSAVDGVRTGALGPAGFFTDDQSDDWFLIGEGGVNLPAFGPVDGMRVAVGGWWHSGEWARFDGGTDDGTGGLYALAEARVWRPEGLDTADEDDSRGLWIFAQYGWADDAVAVAAQQFGGGVSLLGTFATRDDDSLGLYISHVDFGDGAGFGSGGETAIELYYDFAVTPAFHIKPDIQYFVEPSGGSEDSVVGTLRCTLTF
jgi:porin